MCLNSMGHHVWKVIRSKSVFTRVTDGQRCCYYSVYVTLATAIISGTATATHFLIGSQEQGFSDNKVRSYLQIYEENDIDEVFLDIKLNYYFISEFLNLFQEHNQQCYRLRNCCELYCKGLDFF